MKDLGREHECPLLRRPNPSAWPQDDKTRVAQGLFRILITRLFLAGNKIWVALRVASVFFCC